MKSLNISYLQSGGLITNYYCSSKCRHCLYACSPKWPKNYITADAAEKNFETIKKLGCTSIHIGGGEPFLNLKGLEKTLIEADNNNISIDYIETNSSWHKDTEETIDILSNLKRYGVHTLLISISPFHNEHIPFYNVKGLMESCKKTGVNIFPWVMGFYPDIDSFDDKTTHDIDEYIKKYGKSYIENIPSRYWIHFCGRANETFKNIYPLKNTESIIKNSSGCTELSDTSHFHIDLFNNYIPGLCSGFSINSEDLGKPLPDDKYSIVNMLYSEGIKSFLNYAQENYNFIPKKSYLSKCDLCLDIRKYLVLDKKIDSLELNPKEYYSNL